MPDEYVRIGTLSREQAGALQALLHEGYSTLARHGKDIPGDALVVIAFVDMRVAQFDNDWSKTWD